MTGFLALIGLSAISSDKAGGVRPDTHEHNISHFVEVYQLLAGFRREAYSFFIMKQFCIGKEEFKQLFERRQRERVLSLLGEYIGTFSMEEMHDQMVDDQGAFAEAVAVSNAKFTNKTENVEIITAFDLAEFYFPDENPQICLAVKDDFPGDAAVSYDSIVASIENDTPIDCSIGLNGREFHFQIKRYPQAHLAHTREALTEYIKKTMRGYADMKDTILVIILQPNTEEANDLSFKGIHEDIVAIKDEVNFREIDLVYNHRGQEMRWEQIYPEFGHSVKPLLLMSDKYKARQAEWAQRST